MTGPAGFGLVRITNQVNIDTGVTNRLSILGTPCSDEIAVRNADAKRIFVGTAIDQIIGGLGSDWMMGTSADRFADLKRLQRDADFAAFFP